MTELGAVNVMTGIYTGRSPKDKFIVDRADSKIKDVLPEGIDRTEESYKREILKLRIENERLKKNYAVRKTDAGELEYIRLKPKNLKL